MEARFNESVPPGTDEGQRDLNGKVIVRETTSAMVAKIRKAITAAKPVPVPVKPAPLPSAPPLANPPVADEPDWDDNPRA